MPTTLLKHNCEHHDGGAQYIWAAATSSTAGLVTSSSCLAVGIIFLLLRHWVEGSCIYSTHTQKFNLIMHYMNWENYPVELFNAYINFEQTITNVMRFNQLTTGYRLPHVTGILQITDAKLELIRVMNTTPYCLPSTRYWLPYDHFKYFMYGGDYVLPNVTSIESYDSLMAQFLLDYLDKYSGVAMNIIG